MEKPKIIAIGASIAIAAVIGGIFAFYSMDSDPTGPQSETVTTPSSGSPTTTAEESDIVLYVFADGKVAIIDPYSKKVVREITEGLENVSWSDAIASPDHRYVFANDRDNAQVIVIDTQKQDVIKRIEVGPRPVHAYNPNHGDEIWTHSDAEGAFYVISTDTLEVTDIVTAALNKTQGGHGKLAYGEKLESKSAATNTNDNGIHIIDREQKAVTGFMKLCETGGTHAKAYSAASNYIYIECSTDDTVVVVDLQTNTIVNVLDAPGSLFNVLGTDLIAVVDDGMNLVTIIDSTTNQVINKISVEGGPDKIYFYENNGKLYGFTANTMTPDTAVIDMDTMEVVKRIPAGDIERPEGARFLHRGGVVGNGFFATPADGDNVVSIIDAKNLTLHAQIPIKSPHTVLFVPTNN